MTKDSPGRTPRASHPGMWRTRLRRIVALGGMFAAVGGLVTLRSVLTPPPTQALGTSGLAVQVPGSPSPARTAAAPTSGAGGKAPSPTVTPHRKTHRPAHRLITGGAYNVNYGVVQVQVTFVGNHITDVSALSLPQGGRSGDISSFAAPQLRREALSAQNAQIDTVSGASYTSAGYAESLQSALDKANTGN